MVLHLYVLRQLLISTGFALGGIAMLVLPTAAIKAVHELGGVSIVAVFKFMPLVLVELVPYLMPLGFLLGGITVYGGDPGLPVLLSPIGGLLVAFAVGAVALTTRRT